jgi:UDP-2,4-diacetamido-2,4,6-trideoxy-beta-L-altropyranose hydrolase
MIETLGWAIRPASRPEAGGGHVARCTALAVALKAYGPVTVIIERGGDAWLTRLSSAELEAISESDIGHRRFKGLILDDYQMGAPDVANWRALTDGPLIQIDDFGRPLSGIDLAINATPGLTGTRLETVPALLGTTYAMLAAPYSGRSRPAIASQIERVVVGIGWIDTGRITERVLTTLARVISPAVKIDVLLGAQSPNAADVYNLVARHSNWFLHLDAAQPWAVAEGADLAISGAGQSLLERLAFGIPTLAVAVVDNQKPVLAGVVAADAAVELAGPESFLEEAAALRISAVATSRETRERLSVAAQKLVDGRGAERVAFRLSQMASCLPEAGTAKQTSFGRT